MKSIMHHRQRQSIEDLKGFARKHSSHQSHPWARATRQRQGLLRTIRAQHCRPPHQSPRKRRLSDSSRQAPRLFFFIPYSLQIRRRLCASSQGLRRWHVNEGSDRNWIFSSYSHGSFTYHPVRFVSKTIQKYYPTIKYGQRLVDSLIGHATN